MHGWFLTWFPNINVQIAEYCFSTSNQKTTVGSAELKLVVRPVESVLPKLCLLAAEIPSLLKKMLSNNYQPVQSYVNNLERNLQARNKKNMQIYKHHLRSNTIFNS